MECPRAVAFSELDLFICETVVTRDLLDIQRELRANQARKMCVLRTDILV